MGPINPADLHVRREPVVTRGRFDLAVTDRDGSAADDPQPFNYFLSP